MLNVDNVAPFLLDRKLIPVSWIIDGDLIVRSVARRNRNLRIEGPEGAGYFVKQAESPAFDGIGALSGEAAFHRFCQEDPAIGLVRRFIPRLLDVEGAEDVLLFDLIAGSLSLRDCWKAPESRELAATSCRALGQALGRFHGVFRPMHLEREARLAWLADSLPWVFGISRPGPGMLADLSPANHEALRILQTQGDLADALDRLRGVWRAETVIHGDIRMDNIMVRAPREADVTRTPELWITDWEMVQYGDPAWDLAGAFQDFLVLWVSTMPFTDKMTEDEKIARALVPLDILRRGSRALWSGYRIGAA